MDVFYKAKQLSLSKFIRLFAIWIIVLLPFQNLPRTLSLKWPNSFGSLSQFFLNSDELLTLLLFIVLGSWICLRGLPRQFHRFSVLYVLLLFMLVCLLGIYINNISMYRGLLAIFDYSKNIAIAVLFYWLGYQYSEFKKALILFINIGLLVAVIGLFGECLAFATDSVIDVLVRPETRFGFYRVTSVAGVGSSNYVGVYAVLVFWLLVAMKNEFNHLKLKLFILLLFMFLTASRQTWLSFFLLAFLHASKKQFVGGVIIGLLVVSTGYALDLWSSIPEDELTGGLNYRSITYSICWGYFKSNPLWGVGPGMLGGLAVQKLWSPLYASWPPEVMWFLGKMQGGLDQFWGRLFADLGIMGGGTYLLIFGALGRDLISASHFFCKNDYELLRSVGKVLACYILVLAIMGLAGGINAALLIYPFLAFSGMYLSLFKKSKEIIVTHDNRMRHPLLE